MFREEGHLNGEEGHLNGEEGHLSSPVNSETLTACHNSVRYLKLSRFENISL